jgi:Phosphodiester glycosidase
MAPGFRDRVKAPGKDIGRPSAGRSQLSWRRHFRHFLRGAGVVMVVPLLWLTWSIGGALTAPGAAPISTRLAEWVQSHGLGSAVSRPEQVHRQANPPKIDASLDAIPNDSVSLSTPSYRPPRDLPAPNRTAVPAPVPPQAQPSLAADGWQTLASVHGKPAILAEFLRPDAQHARYPIGVAWLDQKLVRLVLHPGDRVPGGSGWSQPSQVPASERDSLLATFNSGFKMVDANGGYWQDGRTAVPLRAGAASMVLYKDGHLDVARWNAGPPGPDVAAVRQNLDLLVDNGAITAKAGSSTTRTWGNTVGNAAFVWRTALGVRQDGSLVFVVGSSLSAYTLATAVRDVGAVRAMELDINQSWTNFITYAHPSKGVAVPHMLTSDEHPNPYRYLQPSPRDFVAVLAR